ncbi:MAG: chemotaxis protein CheB [Gammaproteobacteria bacterium]
MRNTDRRTDDADAAHEDERPENGKFPVVAIGASAGGLEAFSQLLAQLPDDTGMGFVLVQHLDPKHESKLVDLLAKFTRMPVQEAAQDLAVRPDHIYIIPPNTTLSIAAGVLQLEPRGEARGPHLPIDHFFKSLAEERQTAAIGVILSGTGTDGTLGLEEIKAAGGITFAQDEQTAKHPGMPLSALRSGCIDRVLSPAEIARELARIGRHPYLVPAETEARAPEAAAEASHFKNILALLRSAFNVDFSAYRDTTVKRRIMRRMVLHTRETLGDYAKHLAGDRVELDALYQDILINVTSFFREPETFEALKTRVFPEIIAGKDPNTPIRVWVPGCSTGQEAYSLAMALSEFLEDKPVRPAIQIFATDLSDTVSLSKAREGIYPENIEAEVSPERLRHFFSKEDSRYRVSKTLREMVVFAKQNVASDPPFSHLDLISCRNLLIYLAPPLQKRVIPTFHYALNLAGFLVLGHSETVGAFTDLFGVVDQPHRIYVKQTTAARQYPHFHAEDHRPGAERGHGLADPAPSPADWQREADRVALGQYVPPGVLVNENLDILQFRGQTGPYLAPAPGEPSLNLLKMAREGLFLAVRAALIECQQQGAAVHKCGVRIRGEAVEREIDLRVLPIKLPRAGERCYLVLFEENVRREKPPPEAVRPEPAEAADGAEINLLRQELASTRDYLQSVIEQQDAANEELKSANEEILSSNEELQSTNEELETAKEELQSVNEELTTINEQLQVRNADLGRLNDDMTNLLGSSGVPMMVLGTDLRIRRFTLAAGKALDLHPGDIGRPIGNLKLPIEAPDLEALIREVIDTVRMQEREVEDKLGRWYSLRLHPYRTSDNRIDGVVLVLADIDALKRSEREEKAARAYAEAILRTTRNPMLVLRADLLVNTANEAFYKTFQVAPEETEGRLIYELGNRQWDIPKLRELLEHILPGGSSFNDFEVEHEFETIGRRSMRLNARRLDTAAGKPEWMLLAIEDITERKRAKEALRQRSEQFEALLNQAPIGVYLVDADFRIRQVNPAARPVFGDIPDLIGRDFDEVIHILWSKEYADEIVRLFRHTLETGEPYLTPERIEQRRDRGVTESYRWQINRILLPESRYCVVCYFEDIAAQVQARDELKNADRRKNEFLAMLAHELRNPLAPIRNALEVLRLKARRNPKRPEDEAVQAASEMMERQLGQMVRLVDDLLDASRISRGKIDLRKERIELASAVHHAVETARPLYESMDHELTITLPPQPVYLNADPARLAQVVGNLLNNACKFTERGGRIGVTVEREGGEAVIRVRDTGVGIATEELPRIFEMFTQLDTSLERSRSGLGIGLALVKNLVELHGGTVEVHSAGLGQGSEFRVRLPIVVETPEPLPEPAPRAPPPTIARRILVVDDNRDSAESLTMLLNLAGHETRIAYDGLEAVEAAATFRPDVILLDIGLPILNGFEAARKIREQWGQDMVLVALTGWGQEEDRRRSEEAGFNAHMVKPVDYAALTKLLAEFAGREGVRSV